MVKFSTFSRAGEVRGNQYETRRYYALAIKQSEILESVQVVEALRELSKLEKDKLGLEEATHPAWMANL